MEENEIGSIVMTAALELRRELGPGLLESGEFQGINFETDLPACSFLFLISASLREYLFIIYLYQQPPSARGGSP